MLDDASLYASVQHLDEGSHLSDSSDSGLSECFPVKEEPLSPAFSQCSEHSNDSLNSHVSIKHRLVIKVGSKYILIHMVLIFSPHHSVLKLIKSWQDLN